MLTKIVLSCLLLLAPTLVFSQCWPEADKLVPNKSIDNAEGFGRSIDYADNIAVVGAPASDTLRNGSGVAYVFQFDGNEWYKIASLVPSDYQEYWGFGQTVRISNDRIYVTNPSHTQSDNSQGVIYVYEKPAGGWHDMTETLILSAGDSNSRGFGVSLDIFENTLIVGSPYSLNVNNEGIGAAYVFQWQSDHWNKIAKFSSGNALGNTFGSNVAISRNLAVVVASEETIGSSTGVGACYVFEKANADPWTNAFPLGRLSKKSTDPSISYLGYGLAIDENRQTIFIGDNLIYDKTNDTYSKGIRAYVKPSGGWKDMTENSIYTSFEPSGVWLGSVQFEEPYLYFSGTRSIKIFKPDNTNSWNTLMPSASLINLDNGIAQSFGSAFCVENGHVLVGAPAGLDFDRDHPILPLTPAIYEFILPATGWADNIYNQNYQFTYMPKTAASFTFGSVVDIDGKYMVVGAPRDNYGGRKAGAAYVYHLVDLAWKKIATLSSSDGEPYDFFGGNVAISKNHIAITAINKHYRNEEGKVIDFNLGAVYVFENTSGEEWKDMHETYKIIKSDGKYDSTDHERDDDGFGQAVDMDFPYLVVSRFDGGSRPNNGSVYVYNLSDSSQPLLEATLNPSMREGVNDFGTAIKIKNNTIALSNGEIRGWFLEANAVFIYTKNEDQWKDAFESAILYPSPNDANSYLSGIAFGYSIDMNESATRIIVGAPGWFDGIIFQTTDYFKGAAYIYEKPVDGWKGNIKEKARLTVPNQPAYGCMGVSVHIEDRYAVVGSPQNYFYTYSGSREGPGRVYFYQMPQDGWAAKNPDKIIRGDEAANVESDYFGSAVDGVYGFLMIGALADDNQNSVDAGSVYVYTEYPFIYPGQSMMCENEDPISLTAYPQGGQWTGAGIHDPAEGLFDPLLAGKGIHQIHYKVDDCDASNTFIIEVKEMVKPFALSASDSIFFCGAKDVTLTLPVGDDFTQQWYYSRTGSGYTTLGQPTPTLKATLEGFYKGNVSNSCSEQNDSVWVGNLYPYAGEGFGICITTTAVVVQGNYPNGIWSGDGMSTHGYFTPATAGMGDHILTYSVSPYAGCVYQDTAKATVNGIINLDITAQGADLFCYTGLSVLTATDFANVKYQWYYGQSELNLAPLDEMSNSIDALDLGFYKVTATDNGQCFKDAFYELIPAFNPTITPLFDSLSFCYNTPIKIEAQTIPDAAYFWRLQRDNNHHVIEETNDSFVTEIKESGSYSLVIHSNGCEYTSAEMITHKIPADSVFIPNIITPNGDRDNEVLEIYANEGIDSYSLRLFNRYGEEVFNYEGTNRSTGWSGENLSSGVYFLTLRYFDRCENKTMVYKGPLTIFR